MSIWPAYSAGTDISLNMVAWMLGHLDIAKRQPVV
jgi:hypothetical protein